MPEPLEPDPFRPDYGHACITCGGPMGDSVSDDFCDAGCQRAWAATRSAPLEHYREPALPGRFEGLGGELVDVHHHVPWSGLPPQSSDLRADRVACVRAWRTAVTEDELAAVRLRQSQIDEREYGQIKIRVEVDTSQFQATILALQPIFGQIGEVIGEAIGEAGRAFASWRESIAEAVQSIEGIPRAVVHVGPVCRSIGCNQPVPQGRRECSIHHGTSNGPPVRQRPPRSMGRAHTFRR